MTTTLGQFLQLAVHCYQTGQWQQAEQLCRQALEQDPHHVDALHLRGLIAAVSGNHTLARDYLHQVLRLQPNVAEAHNNLGNVLIQMGELDEAVAAYQHALRLQAGYAEAHCNLGTALQRQGKSREAQASFQEAVRFRPDYADAHYNLGIALMQEGNAKEAIASYREVLRWRPDFADAHNNLGIAFRELGRLDEAITSHEQALRLRPDCAEFHYNLGLALKGSDRLDEALGSFERAIHYRPDYAEPHVDLGLTHQLQGRIQQALANFEEALHIRPDYAAAHMAKASVLLAIGDFASGLEEYEWRFRWDEFTKGSLHHAEPAWDGSPLDGRTILVRAEQGLGDTLQFVRYAGLLHERGGRVIVECQPPLLSLLRSCPGVAEVCAQGDAAPPHDVYAYLLSLPRLLGTRLATIPASVPYLSPDAESSARWRRELVIYQGCKVGICWQGNPKFKQDRLRSVPLARFAALAEVPGVRLFGLQVGGGRQQLTGLSGDFTAIDLGQRFDLTSFADAAAVIKNLDLVITTDTAIAHLAGALGTPVWVALSACPDWRWLLERDDCPWYPSMRLFRQTQLGRWEDVFERMAGELRQRVANGAA